MSCEKAREHLQAWSDGERLNGWKLEFAALTHYLHCASCRRYWRQLRRLRHTTRRMPSALPAALEPRLFALLAAQTPDPNPAETAYLPQLTLSKEMKMRKRLTAATCGALVVALTGALAAQMLDHKMGAVIEDRTGHQWRISSDYRGMIKLYDPNGAIIGVTFNQQRNAIAAGTVQLDVAGAHYQLHPGKQEIRDSSNALIGFAELTADVDAQNALIADSNKKAAWLLEALKQSETQERKVVPSLEALKQSEAEEMKYGGASGLSASLLGAHGWDKTMGVDWKIRGSVSVRVFNAAGHETGSAAGIPLTPELRRQLGANTPPAVPVLEITVNGKHSRKQGYGSYDIKNAAGKVLLRLNAQALDPSPEAVSVPAPVNNAHAPTR